MPISINCPNKGCGKIQEPYLDPDDNKIYCSECNKEIPNISIFMKNQLRSSKQFKPKNNTSYSVKCKKCNKEGRPKLSNNDVVCNFCNKSLDHLSFPFKNMLKDKLKNIDKD